MDKFAAFILSHGRPDNVKTYKTLRGCGYTGRIVVIVDDQDPHLEGYRERFGDELYVFDKAHAMAITDACDNFGKKGTPLYARNMCHSICAELGLQYFIELDDDYHYFEYRFDNELRYKTNGKIKSLDLIFSAMVDFYKATPVLCLCMAQGGDFIGGRDNINGRKVFLSRKAMNSFVCGVDRPFQFVGTLNDDTNTYVTQNVRGGLMTTINMVSLCQSPTQQNDAGMTDIYLQFGTYAKSMYTVIMQPSSVRVQAMGDRMTRLHHRVDWNMTAPKIVSEQLRKASQ